MCISLTHYKLFIKHKANIYLLCSSLEDELHAVFSCPQPNVIRPRYMHIMNKYHSIRLILNPDLSDIFAISEYFK